MLDLRYIIENREAIEQNNKNRNVIVNIEELIALDDERRALLKKIEDLRSKRNITSKERPADEDILLMRKLGTEVKQLETIMHNLEEKQNDILCRIPNLTHPKSPLGGEDDFVILSANQKAEQFDFEPKNHEDLMTNLDLIDFERGAKVAGSKFYFIKNQLVRLNQALINYGMDTAQKYGYEIIETPDLANSHTMEGSGFNPRGEETQIYEIKNFDLSLIGTAEITMLGYHADEVLDLKKGPKKYVALSHCFRTEGGAYGKASKGLYRVHQFTKLEMFVFCKPAESEKYHKEMLDIEKEIIDGLELPYRVIDVASEDLGGPAYRKYDMEAYMTMKGDDDKQGDYGEISSASICTDYQARRLNIKYKANSGKNEFVHTINGTAIALSRLPIAIIENHQNEDGSINIPPALQKYTGFDKIEK